MACVHGTATGGPTSATLLTGDQQASPEVLPPSVDTPVVGRWLRHGLFKSCTTLRSQDGVRNKLRKGCNTVSVFVTWHVGTTCCAVEQCYRQIQCITSKDHSSGRVAWIQACCCPNHLHTKKDTVTMHSQLTGQWDPVSDGEDHTLRHPAHISSLRTA
jgi:hypothetical protein